MSLSRVFVGLSFKSDLRTRVKSGKNMIFVPCSSVILYIKKFSLFGWRVRVHRVLYLQKIKSISSFYTPLHCKLKLFFCRFFHRERQLRGTQPTEGIYSCWPLIFGKYTPNVPLKDPINFFCFVDCKISFYIVKEVLSTFVFWSLYIVK